jgi:hypothetical protein
MQKVCDISFQESVTVKTCSNSASEFYGLYDAICIL